MTAYDINPYKGSESSTGWNFVIQAARFNKVVAVTRKNNRKNIERYIKEFDINNSNLAFYYYDFPYYLRFWKKGARGSSLYFYLWQMFMPLFVQNNKIKFDIAHNVNFHADAFPTFLWVLGKPLVWGPINHNEKIPEQYILEKKEYLKDRMKWFIKNISWKVDPFILLAKYYSDIIIGGNSSIQKRLNIQDNKFVQMTQVAYFLNKSRYKEKESNYFTILVVGRFLAIKSFNLAIYSFELFYKNLSEDDKKNVKLRIIGEGSLNKVLNKIAKDSICTNSIEFLGWVDKENIDSYYKEAMIFLFPSHEGAGMVVVEALSHALPVICFDNYGAGEFVNSSCAIKVPYTNFQQSVVDYSNAILKLYYDKNLCLSMSNSSQLLFKKKYTWDIKGSRLKIIYDKL